MILFKENYRTVIAEADFLAAQHLAEFLSKYRIDVEFDYVAPDGIINLTQPGIIAICGSKSSSMIADALSHDKTTDRKSVV